MTNASTVQLKRLLKALQQQDRTLRVINARDSDITGVSDDSRSVKPGNLFAALPGAKADGTRFVSDALKAGAAALLLPKPLPIKSVPQIISDNPRRALGLIASLLYGQPSRQMRVIGITGTNGKTTSAFLLREIFERCGIPCGLMGTVVNVVGREHRPAKLTTPGAIEIQRTLAEMRDAGQQACIMEVSSHALAQERVAGVQFAGGIFTNLTRDHLDYHGDFDAYFDAKARLFEMLEPDGAGVVNLDSEYGAAMAERCNGIAYSFGRGDTDLTIADERLGIDGMSFSLRWLSHNWSFQSPLTGRYNVENIAGTVALALALDLPLQEIRAAVKDFHGAPGRLERVPFEMPGPTVFVDYAHTPDAMQNVLSTLREVCKGRKLVCVFGCGGDRDRTKRPRMGAIGASLSDRPIITSDNPRSEDPQAIMEEVLAGIPPQNRPVETYVDRREAIQQAMAQAAPEDVVVIVGKGHETYQIFSDRTVHFDDKEEARRALEVHWGKIGSGRREPASV